MKTYMALIDGMDYATEEFYTVETLTQALMMIEGDLEDCGGGCAEVYDEDGELVEVVEI